MLTNHVLPKQILALVFGDTTVHRFFTVQSNQLRIWFVYRGTEKPEQFLSILYLSVHSYHRAAPFRYARFEKLHMRTR